MVLVAGRVSQSGGQRRQRTSSLLDCFCRLALTEDTPASLAPDGVDSSTGLGIPDAAGLLAKGIAPRPPRFGVPRMVPGLTDMIVVVEITEIRWCTNCGYSYNNCLLSAVARVTGTVDVPSKLQSRANEAMDQMTGLELCGQRKNTGSNLALVVSATHRPCSCHSCTIHLGHLHLIAGGCNGKISQ